MKRKRKGINVKIGRITRAKGERGRRRRRRDSVNVSLEIGEEDDQGLKK